MTGVAGGWQRGSEVELGNDDRGFYCGAGVCWGGPEGGGPLDAQGGDEGGWGGDNIDDDN